MKLQLQGQRLRVRIDEEELGRLLADETLVEVHVFGAAFALRHRLTLAAERKPSLEGAADDWWLQLPKAAVAELATRLPSRDGLSFELGAAGASQLTIRFDVDVRDSVGRRGAAASRRS